MIGRQNPHPPAGLAPMPPTLSTTSLIYVVGEVVISILAMVGGFVLVFYSEQSDVKLVGSGVLSAVTALWFARRQGEQSNNALQSLANGKLSQLLEHQAQQQVRTDALVTMMAHMKREG